MHRLKPHRLSLLLLAGTVLVTLGVALLYLYLAEVDEVGVWYSVFGALLSLLTLLPIFFGLGAALRFAAVGNLRTGIRILAAILAATFVYQTLVTMLDYLIYYDYLFWAALLFGLLGGLISGALYNGLLMLILFSIAYLLFMRKENDARGSIGYASAAVIIGYLLYRIIQETVSVLTFLSEHFWIANRSEIISFILYYAFDLLLAAAAYLFLRLGRRFAPRLVPFSFT